MVNGYTTSLLGAVLAGAVALAFYESPIDFDLTGSNTAQNSGLVRVLTQMTENPISSKDPILAFNENVKN